MKAMPYLTAEESVTWGAPSVLFAGVELTDEKTPPWDHLTQVDVVVPFRVDAIGFEKETGIPVGGNADPDHLLAVLQVDCPATGYRAVGSSPLLCGITEAGLVAVSLPAGTCARQLDLSAHVLLGDGREHAAASFVAHRWGSRLQTNHRLARVNLEGDKSAFPTEAFSFAGAGLPKEAPWQLQVNADFLDLPYLSSVRLFVNTDHPRALELLDAKPSPFDSVLLTDVMGQLLAAIAAHHQGVGEDELQPGSLGGVAEELCQLFLHMSLSDALNMLRIDNSRFHAVLKAGTDFLR